MIKEAIRKIVEGNNLSVDESYAIMKEIMDGDATSAQIASLLTALRMKGETVDEVMGFVKLMREKSVKIEPASDNLLDTCGTGGDSLDTFNISTTASFVVAGAGVKVAKHGNRAASSKCGSADVLEAVGVNLDLSPKNIAECIDTIGIGFMFAPYMHPAMKYAVPTRKEIGIRTTFNLLGPMTNPANAKTQLIGVFSDKFTEMIADVLGKLGSKRALVVHGFAGLDELSTLGETKISELSDGKVTTYILHPNDVGIKLSTPEDLKANKGEIRDNVEAMMRILEGEIGPKRDITLLNAAAALYVCGKVDNIKDGVLMAADSIDSENALRVLRSFAKMSQEMGEN